MTHMYTVHTPLHTFIISFLTTTLQRCWPPSKVLVYLHSIPVCRVPYLYTWVSSRCLVDIFFICYVEKHTILDIYDDYLVARSKFMTYKWYATLSLGGGRVERGVHIWILEKWDLIWTFDDKLLAAWDVTWRHTFLVVSFKGKKN